MSYGEEREVYAKATLIRDFAARFPTLRPRVALVMDTDGCAIDYNLPGRFGVFYAFNASIMCFDCTSAMVGNRLDREFPQAEIVAGGFPGECTFHVPNSIFPAFAKAAGIRQRRRRVLTDEQKAAGAARLQSYRDKLKGTTRGEFASKVAPVKNTTQEAKS